MERPKALLAAAAIAATLTATAAAVAANSGLAGGREDHVGTLTATTLPREITVSVDPAAGTVSTVTTGAAAPASPPAATTDTRVPAVTASHDEHEPDHGGDGHDDGHEVGESDD